MTPPVPLPPKRVVRKPPEPGVLECVGSVDPAAIPRAMDEGAADDLPEGGRAALDADVQGLPARVRVPALADAKVGVRVVALDGVGALANDVTDIQDPRRGC